VPFKIFIVLSAGNTHCHNSVNQLRGLIHNQSFLTICNVPLADKRLHQYQQNDEMSFMN